MNIFYGNLLVINGKTIVFPLFYVSYLQKLKANPPSDSLAESKVIVRRLLGMQGSERLAETHTRIAERLMSYIRDDFTYLNYSKLHLSLLFSHSAFRNSK